MITPICDFVKKYAESKDIRLHMPGHKGKCFMGAEHLDITEIDGADVLYHACGIIKQSEENAASLFGTAKTLYSTEGSSLSIRAMLYLAILGKTSGGKRPVIAAGRNAHKVFMTASALLDFDIDWLYPERREGVVSCEIKPEMLEKYLSETSEKPAAVYITSPDYLGNIADISRLSKVCRKHGVMLLVDNAHGAYLKFLSEDIHPITLGADMCCDSAHKTLPVLTGGGYLHISRNAPSYISDNAENAMSLFASTSPSYLILQSLDMANRYLSEGYKEKLKKTAEAVQMLKNRISEMGYTVSGVEALKLTIETKPYGYTGTEFADILRLEGMVCEFADPDYVVMMITPETGADSLELLEKALAKIPKKAKITDKAPKLSVPEKKLTPREAMLSLSEKLPLQKCKGRILASANVACPPAIPVIVCGEVIDDAAIRLLEYYGTTECWVIK